MGADPGEECPKPGSGEDFGTKCPIGGYFVRPAARCEGAVHPFAISAVERHPDESEFSVDLLDPEVILIPVAIQISVLVAHDNRIIVVGAGTENQTPCIQQPFDSFPPKVPQGAVVPRKRNENPQANAKVQDGVVVRRFHGASFREWEGWVLRTTKLIYNGKYNKNKNTLFRGICQYF